SYVNDLTDFAATAKAVDAIATEFKKKHPYYRLAFRSVSTLIAYLDPTTTFKFLQPFVGRRKRDKAVSLYVIEKGMHEDKEIEMLSSMMDGTFEFKVEQLRSFMAVRGVCDVQSRAYIKYTHSRSTLSIGSLSLELIKRGIPRPRSAHGLSGSTAYRRRAPQPRRCRHGLPRRYS